MKLLTLIVFAAFGLNAQTGRTVTLNWTASTSPGVTGNNIYRAPGLCTSAVTFAKINAALVVPNTYVDTTMPVYGNYCYYVAAVAPGEESGPSNKADAHVPVAPPGGLTAVSPTAQTIKPGGTVQFLANSTVTEWSLIPAIGSITPAGLYRAPSQITGNNLKVTVQASDGTATALAKVTIRK